MQSESTSSLSPATSDCNQNFPAPSGFEVKFASYANWFTSHGVFLKQKLLQNEGFPMPAKWMMLTPTCNPHLFEDALDAYKYCKKRVPRFMKKVAALLYKWGYFSDPEHCVYWYKLEFQSNGFPHWHVFFNQTVRITEAQLKQITALWKFGRCRMDHLDKHALYAFKYAFKPPFGKFDKHSLTEAVPQWFADYYEIVDGKPETFARARFFQRSRNFLKHHSEWLISKGLRPNQYKVIEPREVKEPVSCEVKVTVAQKLALILSKVQLIARDENYSYLKSCTLYLPISFSEFSEKYLVKGLIDGSVVSLKPNHYHISELPDECITHINKYKQQQIQCQNKLNNRRAHRLQLHKQKLMDSLSVARSCPSLRLKNGKNSEKMRC